MYGIYLQIDYLVEAVEDCPNLIFDPRPEPQTADPTTTTTTTTMMASRLTRYNHGQYR